MGNMDIDSTIIANGKFTLNGELDTPFGDNLILGNPKRLSQCQVLANCPGTNYHHDYRWCDKQDAVSIKGGKAQDDLNKMKEEMEPFQEAIDRT